MITFYFTHWLCSLSKNSEFKHYELDNNQQWWCMSLLNNYFVIMWGLIKQSETRTRCAAICAISPHNEEYGEKIRLADNCQIELDIFCWRISVIHTTPIRSLILKNKKIKWLTLKSKMVISKIQDCYCKVIKVSDISPVLMSVQYWCQSSIDINPVWYQSSSDISPGIIQTPKIKCTKVFHRHPLETSLRKKHHNIEPRGYNESIMCSM